MDESAKTHLILVATILVPIVLFWIDTRRQSHKQHTENQVRISKIETMLEPLWDWWNEKRNGGVH